MSVSAVKVVKLQQGYTGSLITPSQRWPLVYTNFKRKENIFIPKYILVLAS